MLRHNRWERIHAARRRDLRETASQLGHRQGDEWPNPRKVEVNRGVDESDKRWVRNSAATRRNAHDLIVIYAQRLKVMIESVITYWQLE